MHTTILNQGNPHSLNPKLSAAFPKLPDLDSLHREFDRGSKNLVCQEPLFAVPSSPPSHWKAPFSSLTDAELPNRDHVFLYKSINRKISSTALANSTTFSPSLLFAYQKTRPKLNKEVHFMLLNEGERMVQCSSVVSWCGFIRTGGKLDMYALPGVSSLTGWPSLHSSGLASPTPHLSPCLPPAPPHLTPTPTTKVVYNVLEQS